MQVSIRPAASPFEPATDTLLRRMLCPLTGLAQTVGFARRGSLEPRVAVAGGDMTGVHVLNGTRPPREGAYHIGGSGTTYDDVVIRTLGETIERYAQFVPSHDGRRRAVVATRDEMVEAGRAVVANDGGPFFSEAQLARPGFPFAPLPADAAIGWVPARPLPEDGDEVWVPAQQAIVGYARAEDEPQFMAGVTTGTAAHTRLEDAVRNALLELVQIDAAVGHWYGHREAVALGSDRRTRAVDELVSRRLRPGGPAPRFFWLPSADLPGFAVACLLEWDELPRAAVGLGCDLALGPAMVKAFLEGAAVAQLAKVILFRQATAGANPGEASPEAIYDLDTNVAYYAVHGSEQSLRARLGDLASVAPSELPPDAGGAPADDVRLLVEAFRRAEKRLVFLDLTTPDVRELGFCVVRLWTPDLLSLPLPSAPPLEHPRFAAYGGAAHEAPHPYP